MIFGLKNGSVLILHFNIELAETEKDSLIIHKELDIKQFNTSGKVLHET